MDRLKIWNPWWENGKVPPALTGVRRRALAGLLRFGEDYGIVKAVVGPRRAGKTVALYQVAAHFVRLYGRGSVTYVNFEDPRLAAENLDNIVGPAGRKGRRILLLDEIQNCAGWEKWLRTYIDARSGVSFYVSGSTSSTLGGAFYNALAGRAVTIKIQPFCVSEISKALKTPAWKAVRHALSFGAYPAVVLEPDERKKVALLAAYFQTIASRDVAASHGLDAHTTETLLSLLYRNPASPTSLNSLRKTLSISMETMQKYYGALLDSFAIIESRAYDPSIKRQLAFPRKTYPVDIGLRQAVAASPTPDEGRLLETLVAQEITKAGFDLFYWRGKNECDFVLVKNGTPVRAIQVTSELSRGNSEREESGLAEAMKKLKVGGEIVTTENLPKFLAGLEDAAAGI